MATAAQPKTTTVRVALTIKRRGGRKSVIRTAADTDEAIVAPDMAVQEPAEPLPADPKVRALARGFYWRKLIETGQRATVAQVARTERLSAPYVGRLLRMTLMRPEKS